MSSLTVLLQAKVNTLQVGKIAFLFLRCKVSAIFTQWMSPNDIFKIAGQELLGVRNYNAILTYFLAHSLHIKVIATW